MTDNLNNDESQTPAAEGPGRRRKVAAIVAIALAVIAVVVVLVVVSNRNDDDSTNDTASTPTSLETSTSVPASEPATTTASTTSAPSTTVVSTTTGAPGSTVGPTTVLPVDDLSAAVWPWAGSDVRYTDPVEAARGFAVDYIGFTDPIVGQFTQGDARSGEVEVKSIETFAPTTVFVRQLGTDGTWWVIGSATENIVVTEPQVGDSIASPLTVSGQSSAFEGTVDVQIRADGINAPIFTGFVTGGNQIDGLGPFNEVFDWPNPGFGSGAIVFETTSSDDGRILEAGVIRVDFAAT